MKILIMGLPGTGKTTLAKVLARSLNAVHFNADEIRREIHKDLAFSVSDRVEHARRLGILCDIVRRSRAYVIADFVCPTDETRKAFGADFTTFVDRPPIRAYADTSQLFVPPTIYDVKVYGDESPQVWAERIYDLILDKQRRYAQKSNNRTNFDD